MDSDIYSASSAVQHHDHAVLDHLLFNAGLSILSALNWGTFGLETKKQVLRVHRLNQSWLHRSFPHKILVLLTPQSRYSQDPSDLCRNYFPNLLSKLLHSLLSYKLQSASYDFNQLQLSSIDWFCHFFHMEQMHFVLNK